MRDSHQQRTYSFFDKEIHAVGNALKQLSFPGFQKVPVYDVFKFFIDGILRGGLNIRATAIAFNFLLALGPTLVFFLALLPYLPIPNFQEMVTGMLGEFIPENSYIAIEPLINEIFLRNGGIPIFGLLTSLFFAQKGIHGIIEAFNKTYHTIETRSWYRQRVISVALVFIFLSIVAIAGSLFFFTQVLFDKLLELGHLQINAFLVMSAKWFFLLLLTYFSIAFLYYLGPSRKTKLRFFSAGSTLATILTILASLGFTYFMDHFAQLNKFFGSIGALVALMLWMNFNAITLLIGFELNASINNAQLNIPE